MGAREDRPLAGETEFAIVGGGAAGLQLAYFLKRAGHEAPVLERADGVGAFWRTYPRSRELISFNKRYSIYDDPEIALRWDWNSLLTDGYEHLFTEYSERMYPSADEMVRYLGDFASRYAIDVRLRTPVERISRDADGWFRLRTPAGDHRCRRLVMASGLSRPHVPPIPGIEHATGYEDCSLDPGDYAGQRVLVIGKGNSAFEVADRLLDTAALIHLASERSVIFAWTTRHAGNLRAQYARILDAYQLKTLHGALDCTVREIAPTRDGRLRVTVEYVHADSESETFLYDSVIRATGFAFDFSPFDPDCRPAPHPTLTRFPAMTSGWESPNVPGVYFAGTVMQARDFRRASSAFVDGFRYNVRTLARLLANGGEPEPARVLPARPDELGPAVLDRVSRTSALWAQFGHLCDVLVVDGDRVLHYEELPTDLIEDGALGRCEHYYVITLEWGQWDGDVFAIERHPRAEDAYTNVFLHPILRRYRGRELVAVHHVLEDLLGTYHARGETGFVVERGGRDMRTYHREEHEEPLRAFFAHQLAPAAVAG